MTERELNLELAKLDVREQESFIMELRAKLDAAKARYIAKVAEAQSNLDCAMIELERDKAKQAAADHALSNFTD